MRLVLRHFHRRYVGSLALIPTRPVIALSSFLWIEFLTTKPRYAVEDRTRLRVASLEIGSFLNDGRRIQTYFPRRAQVKRNTEPAWSMRNAQNTGVSHTYERH